MIRPLSTEHRFLLWIAARHIGGNHNIRLELSRLCGHHAPTLEMIAEAHAPTMYPVPGVIWGLVQTWDHRLSQSRPQFELRRLDDHSTAIPLMSGNGAATIHRLFPSVYYWPEGIPDPDCPEDFLI